MQKRIEDLEPKLDLYLGLVLELTKDVKEIKEDKDDEESN